MGAKKRAEGGRAVTDESGEQLYRGYRRYLNEMGLSMPKSLEEKFVDIRDEKDPKFLTEVVFWEYIGPDGIRALADALRDTNYVHLRSFRCWKAGAEDEGTRSIAQYMRMTPSILTLELMECGLTSLACEFLGRLLSPEVNCPLQTLRLDHNNIGNEGVINLAKGLSMNSELKTLTMSYCNFDEKAAKPLLQILIFQDSGILDLDLQGNRLGNQGCCFVLHSLKINQSLNRLNIADNGVVTDDNLNDKIIDVLSVNSSLYILDLRLNVLFDDTIEDLLERMKNSSTGRINQTLYEVLLPEDKISQEKAEELEKFLLPNKKNKKGKKKGKRSKK